MFHFSTAHTAQCVHSTLQDACVAILLATAAAAAAASYGVSSHCNIREILTAVLNGAK
jgi:hypothetical protein